MTVTSTPNAQILVSKYHSPFKGARAPGRRLISSWKEERKNKMNLGYCLTPESKEVLKNDGNRSEE